MAEKVDSQQRLRKIEELVHEIEEAGDPHLRSRAVELTSLLMEMHGEGLAKIVEALGQSGAAGQSMLERFTREPLVAGLLLLYGLHPVPLATRVGQALDKVRPLMRSHGGDVELLEVGEELVRLRLTGSCHGCPSSQQTMRNSIEEAIYEFAPDVIELQVEGVAPPPKVASPPASGFVPWEQLVAR